MDEQRVCRLSTSLFFGAKTLRTSCAALAQGARELISEEAEARLRRDGPNAIDDADRTSVLKLIWRQFESPGSHRFDVGSAREGGSVGAMSLVLQTVLKPLCVVDSEARSSFKAVRTIR
jgi:hypothetical protein